MYKKINRCPLCKSNDIKNLIICKDHLVSGESFAINECQKCAFRFTNPRPLDEELGKYYQSEDYISHTNKANSLRHFIYKTVRNYTLQNKLKLIQKLGKKQGNLLDVGCGTGEFLQVCKNDQWMIDGVEPDKNARLKAEKLLNIDIYDDLFSCENFNTYKIITLWHVFEHMPDLHKALKHLKKLLLKQGRIVFALPNFDSYDAEKYKEFWAGYDVPRHLYHFNQNTFKRLMKEHGMKVKTILPMRFDAFYVSLLSERYQNKYFNYIRSFINGCKSNSYAKKNNKNYSSLIYVVKK
jgi:2-polyprenyl-3-methyl-5-hydroxy-6-metoxy-1,4-benzoquinol methylase